MLKVLGPDGVSSAYVALTRESFGRSHTLIVVDEKRARFNLTGYSVKVVVRRISDGRVFEEAASVVDAVNGVVGWAPDGRNFPSEGSYVARLRLEKSGENIETSGFIISVEK
jgi:hypothetical protein